MIPIQNAKVSVEISPDHSCNNWKCCFGCRCIKKLDSSKDSPPSPDSVNMITTVETVTRTYERHHTPSNNQSTESPESQKPIS